MKGAEMYPINEVEQPTVSVVVPWCNRPEIARTLRENYPVVRSSGGELILVNCGGEQNRLHELLRESGVSGVRTVELPAAAFNKALALNLGLELSRAAYFFSLDSDVILQPDVLQQTMAAISGKSAFVTVRWMHESEPQKSAGPFRAAMEKFQNDYLQSMVTTISTQLTFGDGTSVVVPVSRENMFTGARFGNGLLLARKEYLLRVGGYNSEMQLWGWEDLDILLRLKKYLQLEHLEAGEVCHLSHGDELRALNGHTRWTSNLENLSKSFSRYYKGNFIGSLETDRKQWQNNIHEWAA